MVNSLEWQKRAISINLHHQALSKKENDHLVSFCNTKCLALCLLGKIFLEILWYVSLTLYSNILECIHDTGISYGLICVSSALELTFDCGIQQYWRYEMLGRWGLSDFGAYLSPLSLALVRNSTHVIPPAHS